MSSMNVLRDAFETVKGGIPGIVDGLGPEALLWQPGKDANSIGWILWHTARAIDGLSAPVAGLETAWNEGWRKKFNLPYGPDDGGSGQTAEQVAAFTTTDRQLLLGYFDAAYAKWDAALVAAENDPDQVIDTHWISPVPATTCLVVVLNHSTQHMGQAAYIKGLWEKRNA